MSILDARASKAREGGPSFTLGNRLLRAVWRMSWLLLAFWTPPQLHGWRRFLLKCFGARIGDGVRIYGTANVWLPTNLEIEDLATIGPRVILYSMAKITVGRYATISQGAHICSGSHDIADEHFQLIAAPITIGAHAWIAAESFVGPGVTVGEGAVLGARGVAFSKLDPWTVYAGNPARALKKRALHAK